MNVSGAVAVVTGGASGLGAATAALLADHGARVTAFDCGACVTSNPSVSLERVDVTSTESVTAGFDSVEWRDGPVRILVNCAGIFPAGRMINRDGSAHDFEQFRRVLDVNLAGTFLVSSVFASRLSSQPLVEEERGVIVNTASVAAFEGQIGQVAYAASKAGVAGMTLPMARDLARHAIRVTSIAPGLFKTPMAMGFAQEETAAIEAQVPFPSRFGRPEEFAELVLAIISNPMLNGETIRLDAALRMTPR
ncbi:SDR family NAD(P)-dependent oxidoreductase [Novosphingobium aquae]|uniref:SDR family NAD(P)-dependent oxidoreductase n=1 Tax=Novosphingobium aquae TaxID=3133435 RepID=A0ABU8SA43_9SPHN